MTGAPQPQPRWLDPAELRSWRAYVIGSEVLRQRLSRELQDNHRLALADYEVMVHLSEGTDRQLRMSQLAERVASSKSRLSHQVARMERAGLVRRVSCPDDARGVVAELTDAGMLALTAAAPTHLRGVREHMIDLLTPDEQQVLLTAFERILDHLADTRRR